MPLDLEDLSREKTRWIAFEGHLAGVDVLVRLMSPHELHRFRNQLVSQGLTRPGKEHLFEPAPGREKAFFLAIAQQCIVDWRGDIKPPGASYSVEQMGAVLAAYGRAYQAVMAAVMEEDAFFDGAGTPSTGN